MIYSPTHIQYINWVKCFPSFGIVHRTRQQTKNLGKPESTTTSTWKACGKTCAVRRDGSMLKMRWRKLSGAIFANDSVYLQGSTLINWSMRTSLPQLPSWPSARSSIEANSIHFSVAIAVNLLQLAQLPVLVIWWTDFDCTTYFGSRKFAWIHRHFPNNLLLWLTQLQKMVFTWAAIQL